MSTEYRVIWNLGGGPQMTERVAGPEEAAALVRKRERFEGRKLADEEYDLGVIEDSGSERVASLWRGEGGYTFHALVELGRWGRATNKNVS